MMTDISAVVGAVIIGRNEGERLVRCLGSLIGSVTKIVYVDSGSTDESVENARNLGIEVIDLDLSVPFTAARARNEGANYLCKSYPSLRYIQFVDGDCEVQPDWIQISFDFLESNADYAVASGRRRERFPEKSIYNQLCDIEWDTPVGDALSCGGDALIRVAAFKEAGGYDSALIAGEEPEMCYRMRQKDWKMRRIKAEMTLHDAAMYKLNQWWNRAKRAGYAYANSFYLHRGGSEKFKRREVMSIVSWALLFPLCVAFLSFVNPFFIMLLLVYPLQTYRVIGRAKSVGMTSHEATIYGVSSISAKFPQLCGIFSFLGDVFSGRQGHLIEYK